MREVVIANYLRTAQSRSRPSEPGRDWFHKLRSDELLAKLLPELIKRTRLKAEEVDDFIVGSAYGVSEQWTYGGRFPIFLANLPQKIPAKFVDQQCGSGMAGIHIYHSAKKVVDFSERQSRFVSSVTHELKTPLTNIRLYIEMLEQGMARDPEREQEYLRILQSDGARLSRLIENVLELSKLEKKRREPNLLPGRFDDVLAEVETLMRATLKQEGFAWKVDNRLTRPFHYDREIMVQVLINLIENSVKFGKGSGTKEITVRLRERGGRVVVEVADTGPGIPRQDLNKVFNDFYRADNAVARAAGGSTATGAGWLQWQPSGRIGS